MRRVLVGLMVLSVMALAGTSLMAEEESMWLDPANCYFCQPLTEPAGMLENLTWVNSKISNGIVSVTTFKPEFKEAYEAAEAGMMKRFTEFDPTKEHHMCGMCQAWMKVPMDKVAFDNVKFEGGSVGITTTSDPEVLAQLHAITDRTNEEYAAMMKMNMSEGHEGH